MNIFIRSTHLLQNVFNINTSWNLLSTNNTNQKTYFAYRTENLLIIASKILGTAWIWKQKLIAPV